MRIVRIGSMCCVHIAYGAYCIWRILHMRNNITHAWKVREAPMSAVIR